MNFISFFVKNYQFTLVAVLMIVIVSVATLFSMPREEDPEINPPRYPIIVVYPGTSPQDMEELVVKPIEKKIAELEDIKKITTVIDDGVAFFDVEFKYESDVDAKYQELVREVNALRPELPQEIYKLDIKKVTPTDVSVLQVALVSENASDERMRFYAEMLKEDLEKVKSLKGVEYWGAPDPIVRIDLKLDKIAEKKIPLNAIIGSIQSEAANIPGGSIHAGNKVYNLRTSGKYKSVEEIEKTIVFNANGAVTHLNEVADVILSQEEKKHITRINGHRCVLVTAAQKAGHNIAKTREEYSPILNEFHTKLPANIQLIANFDQAENVGRRLGSLGIDFMIAIGLVLITLTPLGWRASVIVMMAIPLSLGMGVIMLNAFGFSLNQLSIVGLVVALGLLVDDSIVVVENVERWLREGHSKTTAVIDGTKQIALAVLGCTATLIIAFLPLAFMPEAAGEFIRSLPMAVITTVFASMIVSLTVVPFLASKILKTSHNPEGNIFLRVLKKIIHSSYTRLLEHSLKRPRFTLLIAFLIFGASLLLFKVIGFRLFPASEKPQFLINVNMPLQTNINATDSMAKYVEQELRNEKQIQYFTTNVGKGNPRIYYNIIPANEKPDLAQFFVQLYPDIRPKEKIKLIDKLRKKFMDVPGAKIEVMDFEQGPPIDAPVAIRVKGDNLDTLRQMAGRIEQLLKGIPGTIYVKNEVSVLKSDIKLNIHTDKARSLGIQTVDIDRTVRLAVAGVTVGKYTNEEGDDYDIVIHSPRNRHTTLSDLSSVYINNMAGTPIPLSQVADIQFETSPSRISHLDKKRYVVVSAFTEEGVLARDITKIFMEKKDQLQLPEGYELQLAGEAESEKDTFGGSFTTVIIATVFLFIMVLILEFKTFKSTLIVLSVIPLGIIGGVTMLFLTGNPMSFVAIIGFIGLAGIEVKNSILLVDFTNQLRAQGKSLDDAIKEAGELRFLPIVLTSMTAIGGLLPIALSSNPLISPLALVLIGGLISSTLLSRIVTPVIYKLIPPKVEIES